MLDNTPMPVSGTGGEVVSPWYDTKSAAKYLSASPKTLTAWRHLGKGPRYRVVGERFVRYHVDELDAFVRGQD